MYERFDILHRQKYVPAELRHQGRNSTVNRSSKNKWHKKAYGNRCRRYPVSLNNNNLWSLRVLQLRITLDILVMKLMNYQENGVDLT